jgi:AgrD protein
MKKIMNMIKKLKKKNWAVIAMNTMALMIIIQNVNSTCIWIDGQPEVPEEAKKFKKW